MKFVCAFIFIPLFSCIQASESKTSTADKPLVVVEEKTINDKSDNLTLAENKALNRNAEEVSTEEAISNMVNEAKTSTKIVVSDSNEAATKEINEVKTTTVAKVSPKEIIKKQSQTEPQLSKVDVEKPAEPVGNHSLSEETKLKVQSSAPVPENVLVNVEDAKTTKSSGKTNHTAFNDLLQSYVSNGTVNYKEFKGSQAKLGDYISSLTSNAPLSDWSNNESLAYWMNLYNAITINLILDNYPLKSIKDLDGGKPWDIKRVTIDGKKYSLNDIEHNTIRPTFKDPRIHFAVNCGAKSCPPISSKAFTADNANGELDRLAKAFINSSANKISADSIAISKIFEWYAEDFGNIVDYINKYSITNVSSGASVSYLDYDWSLNGV